MRVGRLIYVVSFSIQWNNFIKIFLLIERFIVLILIILMQIVIIYVISSFRIELFNRRGYRWEYTWILAK